VFDTESDGKERFQKYVKGESDQKGSFQKLLKEKHNILEKHARLPDIWQYAESDLTMDEKITISNWQNILCDQTDATSTMVESLEMIIKFSNDINKEEDLESPPRITWMDGLLGNYVEPSEKA